MKCDSYIEKIFYYKSIDSLTINEKEHYLQCDACREKTDSYFSLFKIIEKEKKVKVNPFISTNIIAKLEEAPKIIDFKKAILSYAAVIIISIFMGGLGATYFANNTSLLSDNDVISQYFENDVDDFYVENSWLNMNYYNLEN